MLQSRKAKLEEDLKTELTDDTIDDLLRFREAVSVGFDNPTEEERRLWLELMQTKVTVTNGIATVTCRLSRAGERFDLLTGYNTSQSWEAN